MALQLVMMENDRMKHTTGDTTVISRCIQLCQASVEEIAEAANRLTALGARSSIRSKLAVASRESDLRELYDQLETGKTSLLLAWSWYTEHRRRDDVALQQSTMMLLQADITRNSLEMNEYRQSDFRAGTPSRYPDAQRTSTAMTQSAVVSRDDLDEIPQQHTLREKKRHGRRVLIRISLPTWFATNTYYFAASLATGDWKAHLQTINVIPRDSEIFMACRLGQVNRVKTLLRSGKASIHDEDPLGITPLQCTIDFSHVELCQFLLAVGRITNQWNIVHQRLGVQFESENSWSLRPSQCDDASLASLLTHALCREDTFSGEISDDFNRGWTMEEWSWARVVPSEVYPAVEQHLALDFSAQSLISRVDIAIQLDAER